MAALVLQSCATKKSRKDVSFLGKVYHNTTARYNGYFNANEILIATYLELESTNKDNYNKRLKVFAYMGGDADKVKGELDRAIEKVSIVAATHPVSHWRDDCYLLVGESQFLQKDYESAEETLEYFAQEFDPLKARNKGPTRREISEAKKEEEVDREEERKRKIRRRKKSKRKNRRMTREERERLEAKEEAEKAKRLAEEKERREKEKAKEVKGESYFLKHRPVYNDGLIWLARTYIQNDKHTLAFSYLRRLNEDRSLHKEVRSPLYATRAFYYLDLDQPGNAALELEKAYAWEDDRMTKARYAFILGQIMENSAQYAAASEYFDRVLDLKPRYELVFNARLRKLTNSHASGALSTEDFKSEIEDMIKDDKNIEYQDQLYISLANVAFATGQVNDGIDLLKLALSKGNKSSVYKADAYYKVAEFLYSKEEYVAAKAYYDSTLTAMPETDERRLEVEILSKNLTAVAEQITILNMQDSLLRLAALPDEELLQRARELEELEKEAQELEASNDPDEGFKSSSTIRPPGIGGSSFFAYDPLLRDKGFRDFKQSWGDRPLEDDWRRSQKGFSTLTQVEEESEREEKEKFSTEEEALIEKYFSDVPTSPETKAAVLKLKEEALFNLGKLYRDNMQNCEKSRATLEQLLADFPSTEHKMDALFYLYLCANEMDDETAKENYADKLTSEYPESLYAQSILDPDFIKKQEAAKKKLETYYQETFDHLQAGHYDIVQNRLDQVDQLFTNRGPLAAKFALLSAMMAGQRDGKDSYIKALQDVIAKHKETPEATRAREIMRFLQGDKDAFTVTQDGQLVNTKFKLEEDKLHYVFAVIFDLDNKDMTDVKISVSEYNRRFHRKERLSLSTLDLDIENSTPLILVRKFQNKKEAMEYYSGIQRKPDKFIPDGVQFEVYAVSQHNYREVIKERSVKTYRSFFNDHYLID